MTKTRTVKIPVELLADLIGPVHAQAEDWFKRAAHHRSINQFDIAQNCERSGDEKAAIANQSRQLLDMPPFTYR